MKIEDMTQVTDDLNKSTYTPEAVLISYKNSNDDYFLETRKILKDGTMGAGKPVSKKFLNGMLSNFSVTFTQTPQGPVPQNLLYADSRPGNEKYIWWEPAQKRHQAFVKSLEMHDGDYPMPAVIYVVKNDDLYIFAIKDRKPKPTTKLYKGPFFNYYEDGRICLGDAKVKMPSPLTWKALQESWQTLFWNSVNSHIMNYGNPINGNLVTVLKEHENKDAFDNTVLIATRNKLEDLYNA